MRLTGKKGIPYLLIFLFLLLLWVPVVPQVSAARERFMRSDHFVQISEKIKPSVVNIILSRKGESEKGRFRLLFDKFLGGKRTDDIEDFFSYILFQEFPQRTYLEKLVGSGMVIRSDGLILTNEHVVANEGSLEVILSDGRTLPAKVVGTDYMTDLAVIKIEAEDFPTVLFGDSEKLRVGEWVLAIGNSLGLQYTVSAGIVSAKGRYLAEESSRPYSNMIQTDTPINLGNSGGPLVDMKGKVIGVNTSIIPGGQSIGFAIPINEAKKILPDLIHKGEVTRGWLGFMLQSGTNAEDLYIIERVIQDGPGEKAGLRAGDKILTINGMKLRTRKEIHDLIKSTEIGSNISLLIERNGNTLLIDAVVEPMPIPRFKRRTSYPPGLEGFILRLPERTRWLLIAGTILFLILLIAVKRDMGRRSRKAFRRSEDKRKEHRRKIDLPFEKIRVTAERRKSDRRRSYRRQKNSWLKIS